MWCTECGHKLEEGEAFCPECGNAVEAVEQSEYADAVAAQSDATGNSANHESPANAAELPANSADTPEGKAVTNNESDAQTAPANAKVGGEDLVRAIAGQYGMGASDDEQGVSTYPAPKHPASIGAIAAQDYATSQFSADDGFTSQIATQDGKTTQIAAHDGATAQTPVQDYPTSQIALPQDHTGYLDFDGTGYQPVGGGTVDALRDSSGLDVMADDSNTQFIPVPNVPPQQQPYPYPNGGSGTQSYTPIQDSMPQKKKKSGTVLLVLTVCAVAVVGLLIGTRIGGLWGTDADENWIITKFDTGEIVDVLLSTKIVPRDSNGTALTDYYVRVLGAVDEDGEAVDTLSYPRLSVQTPNGFSVSDFTSGTSDNVRTVTYYLKVTDSSGNDVGQMQVRTSGSNSGGSSGGGTSGTGGASGGSTKGTTSEDSIREDEKVYVEPDSGYPPSSGGTHTVSASSKQGPYVAFLEALDELANDHGQPGVIAQKVDSSTYRAWAQGLSYAKLVDFGDGNQRLLVAYCTVNAQNAYSAALESDGAYVVEVWEYDGESDEAKRVFQSNAYVYKQSSSIVYQRMNINIPTEYSVDDYASIGEGTYLTFDRNTFYGITDEGEFGEVVSYSRTYSDTNPEFYVDGKSCDENTYMEAYRKYDAYSWHLNFGLMSYGTTEQDARGAEFDFTKQENYYCGPEFCVNEVTGLYKELTSHVYNTSDSNTKTVTGDTPTPPHSTSSTASVTSAASTASTASNDDLAALRSIDVSTSGASKLREGASDAQLTDAEKKSLTSFLSDITRAGFGNAESGFEYDGGYWLGDSADPEDMLWFAVSATKNGMSSVANVETLSDTQETWFESSSTRQRISLDGVNSVLAQFVDASVQASDFENYAVNDHVTYKDGYIYFATTNPFVCKGACFVDAAYDIADDAVLVDFTWVSDNTGADNELKSAELSKYDADSYIEELKGKSSSANPQRIYGQAIVQMGANGSYKLISYSMGREVAQGDAPSNNSSAEENIKAFMTAWLDDWKFENGEFVYLDSRNMETMLTYVDSNSSLCSTIKSDFASQEVGDNFWYRDAAMNVQKIDVSSNDDGSYTVVVSYYATQNDDYLKQQYERGEWSGTYTAEEIEALPEFTYKVEVNSEGLLTSCTRQ